MKSFLEKIGVLAPEQPKVEAPAQPTQPTALYEDDIVIIGGSRSTGLPSGLINSIKEAAQASESTVVDKQQEGQFVDLKSQLVSGLEGFAHQAEGLQPLWKFLEAFKKLEAVTDLPSRYKAALSVSGLLPTDVMKAAKDYPELINFISTQKSNELVNDAKPTLDQLSGKVNDLRTQREKLQQSLANLDVQIEEAESDRTKFENSVQMGQLACNAAAKQLVSEFKDTGEQIDKYLTLSLDSLGGNSK